MQTALDWLVWVWMADDPRAVIFILVTIGGTVVVGGFVLRLVGRVPEDPS